MSSIGASARIHDCNDEEDGIDEQIEQKLEKYKGITLKQNASNPLLKEKGALDKVSLVRIFSYDDIQPVARNFSKVLAPQAVEVNDELNFEKQNGEILKTENNIGRTPIHKSSKLNLKAMTFVDDDGFQQNQNDRVSFTHGSSQNRESITKINSSFINHNQKGKVSNKELMIAIDHVILEEPDDKENSARYDEIDALIQDAGSSPS